MNNIASRKRKMLENICAANACDDALCNTALAQLALDAGDRAEINRRILKTARWFAGDKCPYLGRDPHGEPDFAAIKLVRLLYMFEDALDNKTLSAVISFFTDNDFESKYKSENHMLLFRVSRFLFARKYPEKYSAAYGKKFSDLLPEDDRFLTEYLTFRLKYGWAEFDSFGYYNEDMQALLTLYDFAGSSLKLLAKKSADFIVTDMLCDCMGEVYCGAHGRVYASEVLNGENSDMASVYYICFGGSMPKTHNTELCLSGYAPEVRIYKAYCKKPSVYESRESHPLHYITEKAPQKQLEYSGGFINKYTYITPDYAIGAVNYQNDYPKGSPAAWYAHHQQHEWELTLDGKFAKIFTHHPGSFGAEGAEHGHWTGDLGCGCGSFFCHKNVLLAMYDIKDGESLCINAYFPEKEFDGIRETKNFIFAKRGNVFAALWFSNGFNRISDTELLSKGAKHGVLCYADTGSDFENFCRRINEKEILFNPSEMTMKFENLYMEKSARMINGDTVNFPYPTLCTPFAVSCVGKAGIEYL